MPLVLPGDIAHAVIKIDGICYQRIDTTSSAVTHEDPSDSYEDCIDCLGSSTASSTGSSEGQTVASSLASNEPSLGTPPSEPSEAVTYCIYSECSSIGSSQVESTTSEDVPSDPSQTPEPSLGGPSEGSSTFCVYSECSASSAVSSYNSSVTSSATSSAASSGCGEDPVCGTAGEGPPMLITLTWAGDDVTKQWNGCTWCNGETKTVWPSEFKWYAFDDKDIGTTQNMMGGYMKWSGPGLAMQRLAQGVHAPKNSYSNTIINNANSFVKILGNVIGATTTRVFNATRSYNLGDANGAPGVDDTRFVNALAWSTHPTQTLVHPNPGNSLRAGMDYDLRIPDPQDNGRAALLQGTLNDNTGNDPIWVSWDYSPFDWLSEQQESGGLMGEEPNPMPTLKPDTGVGGGMQDCGGPNGNPTLFMTLSWTGGAPGTTYNITGMTVNSGILTVTTDVIHAINVGDFVKFSGTSTRQTINAGEIFNKWKVISAGAMTFTIDLNVDNLSSVEIIDPAVGTVELLPVETKSWLGCTWTNGETKNVYPTTYNKSKASFQGYVRPQHRWHRSNGLLLNVVQDYPSASNSLTPNEVYVATESIFLRTILNVWVGDSANVRKNYAGHVPSRTQNGYTGLGILTINDAPVPGEPYTLQEKNLNNTYTDANGVTYSWTEGTGW